MGYFGEYKGMLVSRSRICHSGLELEDGGLDAARSGTS